MSANSPTIIDKMRTKAWLRYVVRSINAQSSQVAANGTTVKAPKNPLSADHAAKVMASDSPTGKKPKLDRYAKGEYVPSFDTRQEIDALGMTPLAERIFTSGLPFNGTVVPFWLLFENATAHLAGAVEDGLREHGSLNLTDDKVTQVAHLFVTPHEWQQICQSTTLTFDEDANPTNHPESNTPNLWYLAAAIAQWRLCMLTQDRAAPMAYLLRCLMAGSYRPILEESNVDQEVIDLLRAWDVEYHLNLGNPAAATIFLDL